MYLLLSQLKTYFETDLAGNANFILICTQFRIHAWSGLTRNFLMTWISLKYYVCVVRRVRRPLREIKWGVSVRKRVVWGSNRWRRLEICPYSIILCTVDSKRTVDSLYCGLYLQVIILCTGVCKDNYDWWVGVAWGECW